MDQTLVAAAPVAAGTCNTAAVSPLPDGAIAVEASGDGVSATGGIGRPARGPVLSGVAAAAAVGLCTGATLAEPLRQVPPLVVLSAVGAGLAIVLRKLDRPKMAGGLVLLAIAAAAAQAGAWRMQAAADQMAAGRAQVQRFSGSQQLRGLIADDPVPRGRTTSVTLSGVLIKNGDSWEPLGARVLLSVPHWPDHEYGEYLQPRGKLQALSGGGAIEALGRQGVLASMSYPRLSYLANPQANPVLVAIFRLRQRLGDTISRTLPDPVASTLKATILGLRSGLPKAEQQALVNSGTVHLVVISGFKLSLLAAGLQVIGLWILRLTTARMFARIAVSGAVLAAIGGYTVLTGATPSAGRAAIMAGLVVLAGLLGRPHDQVAALAIAVLAIVGISPLQVQDAGFQLSCLSVLGIALLAEPLAALLRRPLLRLPQGDGRPGRFAGVAAVALAEAFSASLAATAFDVPVLANSFHIVSLISPIANLLGMPLLAPIMIFGGFGAALGSIWLPLGAVLLWPAWAFTTLLDWLVAWSAGLPHAALPLDGMPPPVVTLYYAALLGFTWRIRMPRPQESIERPKPSKWLAWAAMAAGALAVGIAAALSGRPPTTVRATLLAVPGQAALIQTPSGKTVLVDGGESGPALLHELGQLLPPWQRNLDLVLITSPKTDRIGGLEEVFARYSVGGVVEPDVGRATATFRRLQSNVQRLTADVLDIGDGAVLRREVQGWRLEQGAGSVLVTDTGFEVRTLEGDWRVVPMLRGAKPAADDELALVETGNVTVSLD